MHPQGPPASNYRPISDYALIGNTHSAALVAPDGAIDWCCLPHFDSGAVFCRLLDAHIGGTFRLGPVQPASAQRCYVGDSAVLATEFHNAEGAVRLTDCMPAPPLVMQETTMADGRYRRLLRRVEGLHGAVDVELVFKPTVDFARQPTRLMPSPGGCRAVAAEQALRLVLWPPAPLEWSDGEVRARWRIEAGQTAWALLLPDEDGDAPPLPTPADAEQALQATLARWHDWSALCRYDGPYAREVALSARVLKMLTFAPTGAVVAAPTTSLPEHLGGERNWDYRFCWLRDASLVLHALMSIGHEHAADHFFGWLTTLWHPDRRLQIMYRIDGGERLPEVQLDHLEGYGGSRPVRIGNGAADQLQLDVYGHVLDAAHVYLQRRQAAVPPALAQVLSHLADEAALRWRQPDQGIWEMRRAPAHHVSSKLMCWVALDRALQLAQAGKIDGDIARWARERDAVRAAVHEHGYNARIGAFTQCFGDDTLDASVLMMPIVGFLPARDPRMRGTVERIREHLTRRGLVYRYRGADGLSGGEGAFAICTFWMVDNLSMQGRVEEARALFEHVCGFANDVGLLAEEIEPADGRLLGNHPQGYTHLALIRSALAIGRAEQALAGGRGADT